VVWKLNVSIDTFTAIRNVDFVLIWIIGTADNTYPNGIVTFNEFWILPIAAASTNIDVVLVEIKNTPVRVVNVSSLPVW
jgi:hypothetical protein